MKNSFMAFAAAVLYGLWSAPALAAWPDKPIRLVVPFAAGGSSTSAARILADRLGTVLGKPVFVDNIGGANGGVGAQTAVRAPADGYTLFFSSAGIMTVNPSLYAKLPYAVKDFEPVSLTATFASLLFVNADFPARDAKGLVAYAKAHPGEVTFGSAGYGSSGHLWGEVLKARAGIDIRHVPYKGTSPALVDVMGGNLGFIVDAAVLGMQQVNAGKLRALGATSTRRVESAPDVPTFAEQGLAGFERLSWFGVFVRAGTPPDIVATLHKAIAQVVEAPDYREAIRGQGMTAASSTPADFQTLVRDESAYWGEIIRNAKITVD